MKQVAIIDYGAGNLHSIAKACQKAADKIDIKVVVTNDLKLIDKSSHIILPGVGAFASCMNGLKKITKLIDNLEANIIKSGKPFLGICVGMQLLATRGFENGEHQGLGWIKGEVRKIPSSTDLKIPHMGWNNLDIVKDTPIFESVKNGADVYFVHSYQFICADQNNISATTDYGTCITAAIEYNNIFAVQFHPEKSQNTGLKIIDNFLNIK